MSTQEEVLMFIREFESNSREYLISKGLTEHEIPNAYLQLQWEFLHAVLKKSKKSRLNKTKNYIKHPKASA